MAEVCSQKCDKGRGLRIVGRLKQDRWTKADGHNTSRVSIVAEHIEFKKRTVKQEPTEDLQAIAEATRAAAEQDISLESVLSDEEAIVF